MKKEIQTIVKVEQKGSRFIAVDAKGQDHKVPGYRRKEAFANGEALAQYIGSTGRPYWRPVPMDMFNATANIPQSVMAVDIPADHAASVDFIHSSYKLKPGNLVFLELK